MPRPTLAPLQSLLPFGDHGVLFTGPTGETSTGDRCPEESEAIDQDLEVTTVSKLTIIKGGCNSNPKPCGAGLCMGEKSDFQMQQSHVCSSSEEVEIFNIGVGPEQTQKLLINETSGHY